MNFPGKQDFCGDLKNPLFLAFLDNFSRLNAELPSNFTLFSVFCVKMNCFDKIASQVLLPIRPMLDFDRPPGGAKSVPRYAIFWHIFY